MEDELLRLTAAEQAAEQAAQAAAAAAATQPESNALEVEAKILKAEATRAAYEARVAREKAKKLR